MLCALKVNIINLHVPLEEIISSDILLFLITLKVNIINIHVPLEEIISSDILLFLINPHSFFMCLKAIF